MRFCLLAMLLVMVVASGCVRDSSLTVDCPDGSKAGSIAECAIIVQTSTTIDVGKTLRGCGLMKSEEDGNACITNLAIDAREISLCDRLQDKTWKWVCYNKFNKSGLLPPLETSTTTTARSWTTTTGTIISSMTSASKCGNGMIDEGEDCDMGSLCANGTGVCGITKEPPFYATCMVGNECNWNSQIIAVPPYDMGLCNGCLAPGNESACRCLSNPVTNISRGTSGRAPAGGVKTENPKTETYGVCEDGRCAKAIGSGKSQCTADSSCRHNECIDGRCWMVRSPGIDKCQSDAQCK